MNRYQNVKNDKKKLISKVNVLTKELDQLSTKFSESDKENIKMREIIQKYQKEFKEKDEKIGELSKRLYKFNKSDITIDLDPFEMHRKLRLYQSKLEMSEIHSCKVEEKLKEINHVFMILGVTLDDLKESWRTGVMKFGGLNVKNFELSSAVPLSNNDTVSRVSRKPKKK